MKYPQQVKVGSHTLKQLSDDEYEGSNPEQNIDFLIVVEGDNTYGLIFFDSRIKDPDTAYIDSQSHSGSLLEATQTAFSFINDNSVYLAQKPAKQPKP